MSNWADALAAYNKAKDAPPPKGYESVRDLAVRWGISPATAQQRAFAMMTKGYLERISHKVNGRNAYFYRPKTK
jgi:DNA-binding MarR family transcriptional regulator